MKKKIIGIAMIAAIALGAGWNMMQNENEISLSDLVLSNVEALANGENDLCLNGCVEGEETGCYCYQWYQEYDEYKGW